MDAACFRLAQEAVTNALRHARQASEVVVRVDGDDDHVRVTVVDDGRGHAAPTASTPGFGLVGMAERAKLLGGTFEAGPRPSGGWTVAATFPRRAATTMTIRVLIADDQGIVRTGLRMILDAQPDIEVVGKAVNGRDALQLARRLRPMCASSTSACPRSTASSSHRRLAGPDVADPLAIVVITTFDLDEYVHGALKAGSRAGSC
ncbi:MAG: ATP-binding protein [Acidimicrobiales bacterium]|nr:ATP-binding protein [Acidimicrobiales bacterium]